MLAPVLQNYKPARRRIGAVEATAGWLREGNSSRLRSWLCLHFFQKDDLAQVIHMMFENTVRFPIKSALAGSG